MLIKIAFLNRNENELIRMKKKIIPPESSQKAGKHNVPGPLAHACIFNTSKEKSFSKTKNTTKVLCLYEVNFQTFWA